MAGEKQAAEKAAPALVTITVAQRRTIQLPGKDDQGEPATLSYGPGAKVEVEEGEAKRLRTLGFADPEAVKDDEEPATVVSVGG